jgi:hypothetical protein
MNKIQKNNDPCQISMLTGKGKYMLNNKMNPINRSHKLRQVAEQAKVGLLIHL